MIDVILSADIEFDINGAFAFPQSRKPLGIESIERSANGVASGIDPMMEALSKHSLPASFFIETLQSNYFGHDPMCQVVEKIRNYLPASDFQLHIHPCWDVFLDPDWQTNFKPGKPNDDIRKLDSAQLDSCFQRSIQNFEEIAGKKPTAFRSGNLMVNLEVLKAQARAGIQVGSSVGLAYSYPEEAALQANGGVLNLDGITEIPVFSYEIKNFLLKKIKLLTVEGTPFPIIESILKWALKNNSGPIVLLTHASEFSRNASQDQNPAYVTNKAVVGRWNRLCQFLASQPENFNVTTFGHIEKIPSKLAHCICGNYDANLFQFIRSQLMRN